MPTAKIKALLALRTHFPCASADMRTNLLTKCCHSLPSQRHSLQLQLELQREIASSIPSARLYVISSPHGHDSFLIEIKQLNEAIVQWLRPLDS